MPQDMPPEGGYHSVQYKRNLPARGFRPSFYLLGMGAIMTFGFWQYGKGARERKYVLWTCPGLRLGRGTALDL
jgi:NADH dehydrogenase (ubiquinone) 1 alpha subcomplex subunit 13